MATTNDELGVYCDRIARCSGVRAACVKAVSALLVFLMTTGLLIGQETAPTPTANEQAIAEMQAQIDLLKQQAALEEAKNKLANQRLMEIMDLLPKSSLKNYDPSLTFKNEKQASAETISLSYEALAELSQQIGEAIKPTVAGYTGLVIYHEPDFLGLAKYRLYRNECRIALNNYDLLTKAIERIGESNATLGENQRFRVKSIDPVTLGLNLPAIGTSTARSVAELLSVFRSDTTITQSTDTIDPTSIGTAMANELRKGDPALKIFYPQAFVPEYDLEIEGEGSLFVQMSRVNAASTNVNDFLTETAKLPDAQKNSSPIKETVAFAGAVQKQLKAVTIMDAAPAAGSSGRSNENSALLSGMSDLRQLIRAEKLDEFLRPSGNNSTGSAAPRIGILKLRLLASGGSRKETKNLFLGNKVSYSGGAVVEVLLFDADGTLRSSEIYSLHTGFRKLKTHDQ